MDTNTLNQFIFSQMVMQKAKDLARNSVGDHVKPDEEDIIRAKAELFSERDLVRRLMESTETEPRLRWL